ncbi:unnamed protein product [Bursaphelenchus okinawaensis]|uniref:Uncharacterized protein n=1 Tax=Bursaphelenchus okinawaensis TaxID=465554 RepID=A0A811LFI9_9BILA|nr:unnamed protein product [Bursaphelenchus okinawaensis]CAG9122020.1 unnamed protein product [Bursaphelenchus okinawaensis]
MSRKGLAVMAGLGFAIRFLERWRRARPARNVPFRLDSQFGWARPNMGSSAGKWYRVGLGLLSSSSPYPYGEDEERSSSLLHRGLSSSSQMVKKRRGNGEEEKTEKEKQEEDEEEEEKEEEKEEDAEKEEEEEK